jgi:chromosome segregation ATPase
LAVARARLETVERVHAELQTRTTQLEATLREVQAAASRSGALAESAQQRLTQTTTQLTTAQRDLLQAQAELGRLRAISETVEAITRDRDQRVAELTQLRATVGTQVTEAVKAALAQVTQQQELAAAQWKTERENLRRQISDLEQRVGQAPKATSTTPVDLATKFAQVLSSLAEGQVEPGKPYAAALTSLEVEAHGVLQVPTAAEGQLLFVTPDPAAKLEPAAYSTIKMAFKLLPRAAGDGQPP